MCMVVKFVNLNYLNCFFFFWFDAEDLVAFSLISRQNKDGFAYNWQEFVLLMSIAGICLADVNLLDFVFANLLYGCSKLELA